MIPSDAGTSRRTYDAHPLPSRSPGQDRAKDPGPDGQAPQRTYHHPSVQDLLPQEPNTCKIAAARHVIGEKLHDTGWRDDVTHRELQDINHEVRQLSPAERNETVAGLSDAQLKTWAGEVRSGGVLGSGGLEADERQALLEDLAAGLDGKQLARLSRAFDDRLASDELGDAVAAHAGHGAKVEFVKQLAGEVEGDSRAAVQVAKAIGGLRGDAASVDAALGAHDKQQLATVITAGLQKSNSNDNGIFSQSGSHTFVTYNAEPLRALLDAAATGNDATLKADVFQLAATELKALSQVQGVHGGSTVVMSKGEVTELTKSLSHLITSDTNGVMKELERNDPYGRGLSSFSEQMIRHGHFDEMKVILLQLKTGNDGTEDQVKRFTAVGVDSEGNGQHFNNAEVLGYFVGSVQAGASAINRDADKQASTMKALLAGSLSAGKDIRGAWISDKVGKALLGTGVAVVGTASVLAIDAWNRQAKAATTDWRESFKEMARPQGADGRNYNGPAPEADFDAAISRVADAAAP